MASRRRSWAPAISLAQVGFGLFGRRDLVAQLRDLEFALGQHLHLFGQPACPAPGRGGPEPRFRGLGEQGAFQMRDPVAELLDLAALLGQFLGGAAASLRSRSSRSWVFLVSRSRRCAVLSASTWVRSAISRCAGCRR